MPPRNFAYDSQHVFLTYPQCGDLSKERVRDFFLETTGAQRFYIARELHSDGQPHIHAYIHWGARRRFSGTTIFDVDGHHPNIQKPRSPKHVVEYCAKEDSAPLANFSAADLGNDDVERGWGALLIDCPDADTFLRRVEERYPRDLCLSLGRLLEFCKWKWGSGRMGYTGRTRDQFLEPQSLTDWAAITIEIVVERPLSLILLGESRLGKTEWARSLGPHMYFCGMLNLDDWDDDAKYIVLDDFDIKFFPQWKSFFGAQKSFVLTDKYRQKRTVSWGRPCIWVCNFEGHPRRALSGAQCSWLALNSTTVEITEPLFE
ncbi:replication associated protein [Peromfec virus RodF8_90]|uniref:Replication associated protein n=1 Tax=Peromfec virus RodF8_90 TaxID=2929285 RepID=A0A976N210_9VIRU|nr:replication associated protein [Peromfec virus RodF8_90]